MPVAKSSNVGRARRRYADGSIDFIVGYDLFTDTAYVWAWGEVRDKVCVTICPEAAERWDKLLQDVAQSG